MSCVRAKYGFCFLSKNICTQHAYSLSQIVILKGFYCLVLFVITITMIILLLFMVLIMMMMMTRREWVLSLGAD